MIARMLRVVWAEQQPQVVESLQALPFVTATLEQSSQQGLNTCLLQADFQFAHHQTMLALAAEHGLDFAWLAQRRSLADFALLASDMDSTLITIECIDELADLVGKKEPVQAITKAAMRGEIRDYSHSLRERVAVLAGTDETALQRVFDERLQLSPGAQELYAQLRQNGLKTLLMSGGFYYFTNRLQQQLKLDATLANQLEMHDGKLTGRLLGDIVDGASKRQHLLHMCQQWGIALEKTIAIGDGSNDVPMLLAAGVGVAYCANPIVKQQCLAVIESGRLDHLPALLG